MLVIHGDKDYRVPIGEALRLWWDLLSRQEARTAEPAPVPLLPRREPLDPQAPHAIVWYETVLAFLAQHVLGEEGAMPEILR